MLTRLGLVQLSFIYLFVGLLLLWYPRGWLRLGALPSKHRAKPRRRRKSAEKHRERLPDDQSLWLGEEMSKRRNWLDLFRALAGGYALVGGLGPLLSHGGALSPFLLTTAAVLFVAVGIQTVRFEGKIGLYPPIFFVGGLGFALVGEKAALFAFVTVWALNLALPSASIFLFCYAGIVLILGVMFGAPMTHAGLMAGLALAPVLGSLLTQRRLMAQFGRKAKFISR